ncbi:MAG TPA: hypothetical protein VJ835_06930, partial [Fimbriimonadaceae bacterium]|nr:hypothetical protein [Fimbriimonadaceae bacterium]
MASKKNNAVQREQLAEINPLAKKFAESLESYIQFYQETYSLSREDAEKQARSGINDRQEMLHRPAEQVSWICLSRVSEADPDAGIELWRAIRSEARDEIESGHRAAKVLSHGFDFGPIDRARFLEVRS